MMGLVRPEWANIHDFDAIVASKRKDRSILRDIRDEIETCYRAYLEQAPEFTTLEAQAFSPEQRGALQKCYKADRQVDACKEMLARLQRLNPNQYFCPLCGISEHSTWDHYLPQAMFPEFAVCVYNLVRSCAPCNDGRKHWRGPAGRLILHMYYDDIVQEHTLLDAQVTVVDGRIQVEYKLKNRDDLPPAAEPFAEQFARHCNTLRLLDRFAGAAAPCLYDYIDSLRPYADPATIQQQLKQTAQARARRHGTNHWQAAAFRGAANSASFLEFILQRPNA